MPGGHAWQGHHAWSSARSSAAREDQLSQNILWFVGFLGFGFGGFFYNESLQLGCKNSSLVQVLGARLLEGWHSWVITPHLRDVLH